MSSGVAVHPEVKEKYLEMKMSENKANIPFIIYRLTDTLKEIVVDYVGKEGETFDDFQRIMLEAADKGQGRYAVYDYKEDGSKTGKLVFILWSSDEKCQVKQKMLYTSSKAALIKILEGCYKDVQINEEKEFTLETIMEKLKKSK